MCPGVTSIMRVQRGQSMEAPAPRWPLATAPGPRTPQGPSPPGHGSHLQEGGGGEGAEVGGDAGTQLLLNHLPHRVILGGQAPRGHLIKRPPRAWGTGGRAQGAMGPPPSPPCSREPPPGGAALTRSASMVVLRDQSRAVCSSSRADELRAAGDERGEAQAPRGCDTDKLPSATNPGTADTGADGRRAPRPAQTGTAARSGGQRLPARGGEQGVRSREEEEGVARDSVCAEHGSGCHQGRFWGARGRLPSQSTTEERLSRCHAVPRHSATAGTGTATSQDTSLVPAAQNRQLTESLWLEETPKITHNPTLALTRATKILTPVSLSLPASPAPARTSCGQL